MNKKTEDFLGSDAKKKFFKVNKNLSSEINKFKNSFNHQKEIQVKHIISGKLKILNLNMSKVYENRLFKGVLLSIDDITELVSAQKNAAWSNIARYMAHEIKNPLTPIKLSAQRIENSVREKKLHDLDFFANCTSTIVRQVNSIENLVSEFSNFARMPDRKLSLVSLNNIIESQINAQKIANKNAEFNLQIKPKKINISCDFNQISRLFMNILKNSLESITKKKKNIYKYF
jgi:two-component system nitrogen regulation sensor histidine kinase NtrY